MVTTQAPRTLELSRNRWSSNILRLVFDTAAVRGSDYSGFLPPGSSGLRGLFENTLSPSDGERVGGEGKQSCAGMY
jgi:hypothetical protein